MKEYKEKLDEIHKSRFKEAVVADEQIKNTENTLKVLEREVEKLQETFKRNQILDERGIKMVISMAKNLQDIANKSR